MKSARAAAIGAAALAFAAAPIVATVAATAASAQSYSYQGPGYSYARPPYSYQPPPYSYQAPSYSYEPPGYVYTPPGLYRRGYRANTPDYNQHYQYPESVYGDPRSDRGESQRRRNLYEPYYGKSSAPPYESPTR